MKKIAFVLFIFSGASCSSDHKKETISNYIQYVWKRQAGEIIINKLEDVRSIIGKDSVEFLINEYANGITPKPTLDTILSRIESDIIYNSNLLIKVNEQMDSLISFQNKSDPNDEVVATLVRSSKEMKNMTVQQVNELKYYRSAFKKYSDKKDEVFANEVLCQYKLKGHLPDTTSKIVTQNFYLSPDTRKIYLVK